MVSKPIVSDWSDFQECLRQKIEDSNLQLELTGEIYARILETDPLNTRRLAGVLELEKLILASRMDLLQLLAKYLPPTKLPPEGPADLQNN